MHSGTEGKMSMVAFFDNKNIVIYPILESPHLWVFLE